MADEQVEFKVGGFCRLSATTVAKVDMTPVKLLKGGWPNKFLILEIYDDEKQGKLLRLDPCCEWMVDLSDETQYACKAHPAKYFEPLPGHIKDQQEGDEGEAAEPQGRRYSGFGQDEEGEDAVGVEYVRNGGKGGSFFFRRAGERPFVVRGQAADKLMRFVKKLGILE